MSISSKSNSAKRRRHISEVSVGSPDVAMRMSFEGKNTWTALTWLVPYTPVRMSFKGKYTRTYLACTLHTPVRVCMLHSSEDVF